MSRCTINLYDGEGYVSFEGATVSEALAMKAEYLLEMGGLGTSSQSEPAVEKPVSGFLNKVRGG